MKFDFAEQMARAYDTAKKEWLKDRKNTFKDGRLLGYYEMRESLRAYINENQSLEELKASLALRYERAKKEWLRDRRNPFKDGKFLAFYEMCRIAGMTA